MLFGDTAPVIPRNVRLQRNGVAFESPVRIEPWTEMALTFRHEGEEDPVVCRGVVVSCHGSLRQGYQVLLAFVFLPPQARRLLSLWTTENQA